MTPSLGVTPDEAQLPKGPPAHRGGHIWAVPVLWAQLSGEQILGLDLPGEWVLGLDLFPRGPLFSSSLFLPYCCKYFNEMEKTKKKKERKSHHLKPPGACGPASPGFLRSRVPPLGPGSQDSSVYVCIPSRAGGPPEQLFTVQRQKNLEATAKQRTRFLPGTRFCHLLPCSTCPWHQSAFLGCVPHCLPQDWGPVSPFPPHWPGGGTPHTQRCFCRDGCAVLLSSCLLSFASGIQLGMRS